MPHLSKFVMRDRLATSCFPAVVVVTQLKLNVVRGHLVAHLELVTLAPPTYVDGMYLPIGENLSSNHMPVRFCVVPHTWVYLDAL